MGRWIAALRALFSDEQPALGILEALGAGPKRSKRFGPIRPAPPAGTPEEIHRVLTWMAAAGNGAVGFPPRQVLIGQIVRGLNAAPAAEQKRVREELALHLADPADPQFLSVLQLAGHLPLPEAKPTLLRLLTRPLPGAGKPRAEAETRPAYRLSRETESSTNGQAERLDCHAAVLAALAALRDPELKGVFDMVLAKYSQRSSGDPSRLGICREAAIALVILDPEALEHSLPLELSTDPVLLGRLADRPEAEVRRAVAAWIEALPRPTRSRVAEGLAALRDRARVARLPGR